MAKTRRQKLHFSASLVINLLSGTTASPPEGQISVTNKVKKNKKLMFSVFFRFNHFSVLRLMKCFFFPLPQLTSGGALEAHFLTSSHTSFGAGCVKPPGKGVSDLLQQQDYVSAFFSLTVISQSFFLGMSARHFKRIYKRNWEKLMFKVQDLELTFLTDRWFPCPPKAEAKAYCPWVHESANTLPPVQRSLHTVESESLEGREQVCRQGRQCVPHSSLISSK